jgi:hypothetical protein
MTKAEILTLCTSFSLDLEDDSTISTFFDDVIDDLAQLSMPPFVSGSFIEISENVDEYSFPSTCLRLLHLIMTDKSITECSEDDISAYSTLWRGDLDTPLAFTQESLSRDIPLRITTQPLSPQAQPISSGQISSLAGSMPFTPKTAQPESKIISRSPLLCSPSPKPSPCTPTFKILSSQINANNSLVSS